MKHCLNCGFEVEEDDNFCPECGHWTSRGYSFFKDKDNLKIINGKVVKQQNRLSYLICLVFLFMTLFIGMCIYRGKDILKPFVYIKREAISYKYGYNTTILKNDNQYYNEDIVNLESAKEVISRDLKEQKWQCGNKIEVSKLEDELIEKYGIVNVSFCEMTVAEAEKIKTTIDKLYNLFPGAKGYLTNISLTNATNKTDYVAYFQPIYQFVNSTNSIDEFNKVNKTQILLNAYYFLNDDILNKSVKKNWYVKDATWESLIAHEFGHYITFTTLLKNNNLNDVVFETQETENSIKEIKQIINNQTYAENLVNIALANYNSIEKTNLEIVDFASSISNYAVEKNSKGNLVYDEIIAEAVHDYYLHGNNSDKASLQIILELNKRLNSGDL